MAFRGNFFLLIYVSTTVVSLAITYTLSLASGHVKALLPHLSYLGDKPIESTVFTQCFVVNAVAMALVVQMRFVYVFHCLSQRKASSEAFVLNSAGVWAGHSAAAGLFVLACFQESNAYYVHHLAGTLVYFFGNVLYLTAGTAVSARIASGERERDLLKLRIAINALAVFFFVLFEIGYIVALKRFDKPWEKRAEWASTDGGWYFHVTSTISEWILLFLFLSYFITFYHDLNRTMIAKTQILSDC